MRRLTVLYDADCALCRRAGSWLSEQEPFVRLEFLPAGSAEARARYAELTPAETLRELCVVSDDGSVWRGAKAWIMCLWALKSYRAFASSMATPGRMKLARAFVERVSKHRYQLSSLLGKEVSPGAGR